MSIEYRNEPAANLSSAQERIDALYPDAKTQEPEQPTTPPVKTAADEFGYEPSPEPRTGNPYSLDSGSVTDDLYGAESKVTLSDETDLTLIYSSPEDQAALNANLGFIASEAGASQEDIHDMVNHVNEVLLTGEIPSQQDAMATLYQEHGESLHQKLEDARTLVASFPDLHAWLSETKIGDSPVLINRIIKLTENNRAQARLQKLRTKS